MPERKHAGAPDAVLARPLSLPSYPVATGRPRPGHQRPRARALRVRKRVNAGEIATTWCWYARASKSPFAVRKQIKTERVGKSVSRTEGADGVPWLRWNSGKPLLASPKERCSGQLTVIIGLVPSGCRRRLCAWSFASGFGLPVLIQGVTLATVYGLGWQPARPRLGYQCGKFANKPAMRVMRCWVSTLGTGSYLLVMSRGRSFKG
jgi:hypothetical protein